MWQKRVLILMYWKFMWKIVIVMTLSFGSNKSTILLISCLIKNSSYSIWKFCLYLSWEDIISMGSIGHDC